MLCTSRCLCCSCTDPSVRRQHSGVSGCTILPLPQIAGTSGTTTFLRFWRSADAAGSTLSGGAPSFVLQTAVEAPHGNSKVGVQAGGAQSAGNGI
jgi:hypothetical protein